VHLLLDAFSEGEVRPVALRLANVLVLGLGNPLRGDDGVGPRLVEVIRKQGPPAGAEVLDVGVAGFDLLTLFGTPRAFGGDGPRRVIIVDAADVGLEAGQYARFTPDQVEFAEAGGPGSGAPALPTAHQAGLAEALALARALERPLPEIVVYGVQPASLEWGAGLTAEVEAALPLLVESVLREVERKMPAKILIIEDTPDMALAVRMPLEANGYEVFHALSGQEGLEMVKQVKPDLIILDVMMETTTAGFQVSLQLRSPDPQSEYAEFRHVPILILTAIHTTTSLRFGPDEAYLPVDDFVEKPIDPDVLLEKAKDLIGGAGKGL
jgi:hydrogenase maturation protease